MPLGFPIAGMQHELWCGPPGLSSTDWPCLELIAQAEPRNPSPVFSLSAERPSTGRLPGDRASRTAFQPTPPRARRQEVGHVMRTVKIHGLSLRPARRGISIVMIETDPSVWAVNESCLPVSFVNGSLTVTSYLPQRVRHSNAVSACASDRWYRDRRS